MAGELTLEEVHKQQNDLWASWQDCNQRPFRIDASTAIHFAGCKAAFVDFCAETFTGSSDMIQHPVSKMLAWTAGQAEAGLSEDLGPLCRTAGHVRLQLRKLNGAGERKVDSKQFDEGLNRFGWTGLKWCMTCTACCLHGLCSYRHRWFRAPPV